MKCEKCGSSKLDQINGLTERIEKFCLDCGAVQTGNTPEKRCANCKYRKHEDEYQSQYSRCFACTDYSKWQPVSDGKITYYNQGEIECIDAIRSALTPEEFRGFCKGNILKYTWREKQKGNDSDIQKIKDYTDYLLSFQKTK